MSAATPTGALISGAVFALAIAACTSGTPDEGTVTSAPVVTSVSPTTTAITQAEAGWVPRARMHIPRSEVPAAALDGLIYLPGGFAGRGGFEGVERTVEAYDPETDTWTFVADMPAPRHHLMAAALGGKLYAIGGYESNFGTVRDTVWAYEPSSDTWSEVAPLPRPVAAGTAVSLGDHLYVIGGVDVGTGIFRFDPAANTWDELAEMSEPREHVAAATAGSLIYVIGGRWFDFGERITSEVFDPSTGSWSFLLELSIPRGGHAVAAFQGQILAIGGELLGSRDALTEVEAFDIATSRWGPWPALPVGLHGVPAAVTDGDLYVLGGSKAAGAVLNDGTPYLWAD
ncbi:MAG: Kelch repeat-containing protein [Acidimicrobiia bacterium]